jgi:hypothetical protein
MIVQCRCEGWATTLVKLVRVESVIKSGTQQALGALGLSGAKAGENRFLSGFAERNLNKHGKLRRFETSGVLIDGRTNARHGRVRNAEPGRIVSRKQPGESGTECDQAGAKVREGL